MPSVSCMTLYCRYFTVSSSCIEFISQHTDWIAYQVFQIVQPEAHRTKRTMSFRTVHEICAMPNGYDAGHQIIFSSTLYLELWNLLTLFWDEWLYLCRGVMHDELIKYALPDLLVNLVNVKMGVWMCDENYHFEQHVSLSFITVHHFYLLNFTYSL